MDAIRRYQVGPGVWYVVIPDAETRILCGCPADAIKALIAGGFVHTRTVEGWTIEEGPTAILLADTPVQNGDFCNLSEFPLLHMMFKQGSAIPGHPNYGRFRPTIIGLPEQIEAQLAYTAVGTWGLTDLQEIIDAGVEPDVANEILRYKREFAGGSFGDMRNAVTSLPVSEESPQLMESGVEILRTDLNTFRIRYGEAETTVDLNLPRGERYRAVYEVPAGRPKRDYFAVIHIGDGDGWNPHQPCMSSLVVFQEKLYLIDTGPNVLDSLRGLGVSVSEIAGVFHTHAHDDHFAGLPTIFRSDRRLKHYATPLVRANIARKMAALMSFSDEKLEDYLEPHDLVEGAWNDIDGLEVQPVLSLHPVETTVLLFRTMDFGGYRTYAHLADISSTKVFERIRGGADATPSASALYERMHRAWHTSADLKKVDVGGGMIHGDAGDFVTDESNKLIFSHLTGYPSMYQKQYASVPQFGSHDSLIKSTLTFIAFRVYEHLHPYFPGVPDSDLTMLANSPFVTLEPGSMIARRGAVPESVYLILNGLVEIIDAERETQWLLTHGSTVALGHVLTNQPIPRTYRALSVVRVMQIPVSLFRHVLERHDLLGVMISEARIRDFLENTELFGDRITSHLTVSIARHAERIAVEPGEIVEPSPDASIYLVMAGHISLYDEEHRIERIGPGSSFAEETLILGRARHFFQARAEIASDLLRIPVSFIRDMPIIRWKARESFKRRAQQFNVESRPGLI